MPSEAQFVWPFLQDPPQLAHPYRSDRSLQAMLKRALPAARRAALEPDLHALGDYAVHAWQPAIFHSRREPVLIQWDAWGNRVDRIELTEAWVEGPKLAAAYALLAAGHEGGKHARLEQFARIYLYHVASEFDTCPLAMTNGAATALKAAGNQALIERALPHFLSRDASTFWLSCQWMTENAGGSDVGHSETTARQDTNGQRRLDGRKWFSSAVVGEAALALARPQHADDGAGALALLYVETMNARQRQPELIIDRLKDKLGTHELPTAEIHLDGLPAWPLGELSHGLRHVATMLNVTRTWNAICAVASMARAISLARDCASRRQAFGGPLIEQPLHAQTLADMQAEFEGAFALAFEVAHLLGRVESGHAPSRDAAALRLLTPIGQTMDCQTGHTRLLRSTGVLRRRGRHREHRVTALAARCTGLPHPGRHHWTACVPWPVTASVRCKPRSTSGWRAVMIITRRASSSTRWTALKAGSNNMKTSVAKGRRAPAGFASPWPAARQRPCWYGRPVGRRSRPISAPRLRCSAFSGLAWTD